MANRSYFDQAMLSEGILGTPLEPLARSIFQQESTSGKNTTTSYAGAIGPMQILPSTFNSIADKGWDINDPYHNTRGGLRYLKQGYQASGGDPNLTAAYYYGGPGGMQKLSNGVAVGDPRNPKAPTTAQYAQNVVSNMGNYTISGNNMPPIMNDSEQPSQEAILSQVIQAPQGQGILNRIANRPGLSEALIGMGAGLLGSTGESNPLATGLSKGFQGFNAGMAQGIENQKARVVPIAGGAFSQITHPDGRVEIVPNVEAQKFLRTMVQDKADAAMRQTQYKFDNQPLTPGEQRELRELDTQINDATNKMSAVQRAKTALSDPKINDWTRIAASGLPFGKAISEALGLPEADVNRMVEDLKVDAWLVKSAFLKGAISDAENERLNKPMPSSFASKEKLLNWIEEREKDLAKMQQGLNRIRDTDYRRGARPAPAPSAPGPAANPVPAPAPVESAPLPPVGGGNTDDPLNLGLKKR